MSLSQLTWAKLQGKWPKVDSDLWRQVIEWESFYERLWYILFKMLWWNFKLKRISAYIVFVKYMRILLLWNILMQRLFSLGNWHKWNIYVQLLHVARVFLFFILNLFSTHKVSSYEIPTVRLPVCLFHVLSISPYGCLTVCPELFSGTAHKNFMIFRIRLGIIEHKKWESQIFGGKKQACT